MYSDSFCKAMVLLSWILSFNVFIHSLPPAKCRQHQGSQRSRASRVLQLRANLHPAARPPPGNQLCSCRCSLVHGLAFCQSQGFTLCPQQVACQRNEGGLSANITNVCHFCVNLQVSVVLLIHVKSLQTCSCIPECPGAS